MKTGNSHPFAELRNQVIRPYSDLFIARYGIWFGLIQLRKGMLTVNVENFTLMGTWFLTLGSIDEQTVAKEDAYEDRYTLVLSQVR